MNSDHNATHVIMNTYFELRKEKEAGVTLSPGVQRQLEACHEYLASRGYHVNDIYADRQEHYPIPLRDGETEAWKAAAAFVVGLPPTSPGYKEFYGEIRRKLNFLGVWIA